MTGYAPRRPLGDMIAELSAGAHGIRGDGLRAAGIRTESIELSLPVETMIEQHAEGLVLIADVPRFHRRTDFDLPPGRLQITLVSHPVPEGAP